MGRKIPCKICGDGSLKKRKVYRMSAIVVLIGYLLLIPSLTVMTFSAIGMFTSGAMMKTDATPPPPTASAVLSTLQAAGIPDSISIRIADQQMVDDSELANLTDSQRTTINNVKNQQNAKAAATLASAFMGAGSLCTFVGALVGGLLGWLLVMKKKVLKCSTCGAVIAAS